MSTDLVLKIEDYEGPIHLLLEMFKSNKLEITLLNIDVVLDQYLEYVNSCTNKEVLVAANYLDLAAEIVVYKSKKILKISDEEDEDDEEILLDKEELINKILEYKSYKEVTKDIKILQSKRELFLTKEQCHMEDFLEEKLKPIKQERFLSVVQKFLEDVRKDSENEKVIIKKDLNISDYVDKLKDIMRIDFFTFFMNLDKKERVIYFLAILILLKQNRYDLLENNGNITLINKGV